MNHENPAKKRMLEKFNSIEKEVKRYKSGGFSRLESDEINKLFGFSMAMGLSDLFSLEESEHLHRRVMDLHEVSK